MNGSRAAQSPRAIHAVEPSDRALSHATDDPLARVIDQLGAILAPLLAPPPPKEPWLTTEQLAERLGIGINAARAAAGRAVTKGLVLPQRVGRTLRYDPASVDVIRQAELTGAAR